MKGIAEAIVFLFFLSSKRGRAFMADFHREMTDGPSPEALAVARERLDRMCRDARQRALASGQEAA
jgi:hypothetical protein